MQFEIIIVRIFFFFFRNKYTQERGKDVLTQRHTIYSKEINWNKQVEVFGPMVWISPFFFFIINLFLFWLLRTYISSWICYTLLLIINSSEIEKFYTLYQLIFFFRKVFGFYSLNILTQYSKCLSFFQLKWKMIEIKNNFGKPTN